MNKKIKAGLIQIGDSFGNQYYLPYSVGLLQCYAEKYLEEPDNYEFMPPVYKRMPIHSAVEHLQGADILFFSAYLWNFRISLEIAKNFKFNSPYSMIVFGGPQVPEKTEALEVFLRNYPFIDIGCYGEGEIPFLKLLDNFAEHKWEDVPSIGYINSKGKFIQNPAIERITDLNEIPSPYLEGTFDKLIEENPEVSWSAMLESNRGCPFSCAYCAWGARNKKKVYHYDLDRLYQEIDWFSGKKVEFIFCCDANFGMFEKDIEIAQKVAENKSKFGYPMVFSVQNTKNSTERVFKLQKILNDAGLQKGVNLALQSVNTETLKSIKRRNIKSEVYKNLQQMFAKEGIPTFSDIILGLPKETYETLTKGISYLIESGQHNKIQFINLAILENTAMAEPEYQDEYGLILQESKIIPHHTSLNDSNEVYEKQSLVVGTDTMPKEKWVDSRVFCWMITLLYFDKLLQIPFTVLNKTCAISYRELVEIFFVNSGKYPRISEIHSFYRQKALDIQNGGPECVPSKEWLNSCWPLDEYIFIKLCKEDNLSEFYKEAETALAEFLIENSLEYPETFLHEAVTLNYHLIKKSFIDSDLDISLNYNLYEVYKKALVGVNIPVEKGNYHYLIDRSSQTWFSWDDWFREVVWYGTKTGAFMYNCTEI
jgi:radical SAM superfamily enzyme YgiQ (UPF0313 family)